jgi:hypothetical protein
MQKHVMGLGNVLSCSDIHNFCFFVPHIMMQLLM